MSLKNSILKPLMEHRYFIERVLFFHTITSYQLTVCSSIAVPFYSTKYADFGLVRAANYIPTSLPYMPVSTRMSIG